MEKFAVVAFVMFSIGAMVNSFAFGWDMGYKRAMKETAEKLAETKTAFERLMGGLDDLRRVTDGTEEEEGEVGKERRL